MFELKVECPNCNCSFHMDKVLRQKVEAAARETLSADAAAIESKRNELAKRDSVLLEKEKQLENVVAARVALEIDIKKKEIQKLAEASADQRVASLHAALESANARTLLAEKNELELRARVQQVEDKERQLDLELARRLTDERAKLVDQVSSQVSAEYLQRDLEREAQLADMRNQIVNLKRKAEQGPIQLQGEVLELQIEEMLKELFTADEITPVEKGIRGADVQQVVVNHVGTRCGTILWETKRTKNFQSSWIEKLKIDRNEASADIAVIVTEAFPKDKKLIALVEGIWLVSPEAAQGLAIALRQSLVELARVAHTVVSRTEKADILFRYLTSPAFRQRLESIVEKFTAMREDLDREKRLMTKSWKSREKHLESVIAATMEIYIDIQTVVGRQSLSVPALEISTSEAAELESNG